MASKPMNSQGESVMIPSICMNGPFPPASGWKAGAIVRNPPVWLDAAATKQMTTPAAKIKARTVCAWQERRRRQQIAAAMTMADNERRTLPK